MGETNEECEERVEEIDQTHRRMRHGWGDAHGHIAMLCDGLLHMRANTRKMWRVEGCSAHTPLLSVAADCHQLYKILLQQIQKIWAPPSVHSTATMRCWMKNNTTATLGIDEKGLVRSLFCAILPDLFSEMYQFSYISRISQRMGNRSRVPVPICPSLPRIVGHVMLFLCTSFAVPNTTRSVRLEVRDWGSIQSPLVKILVGFIFDQEVSTSAIDHTLILIKKAFWALHFWNCVEQFE